MVNQKLFLEKNKLLTRQAKMVFLREASILLYCMGSFNLTPFLTKLYYFSATVSLCISDNITSYFQKHTLQDAINKK